jgi:predicted membrane-bound spermidine synthase
MNEAKTIRRGTNLGMCWTWLPLSSVFCDVQVLEASHFSRSIVAIVAGMENMAGTALRHDESWPPDK